MVTTSSADSSPQLDHRRHLQSPSKGSPKLLVLLVQFPDHVGRDLPTREQIQERCQTEVIPYLQQQSYNQYNILECDVQEWMVTDQDEATYSQGRQGLLGPIDSQKFFHAVLNQLDQQAIDNDNTEFWFDYDSDGDFEVDALLVLHSGYPAEFGGNDCTNNRPANFRIASQGHSTGAGFMGGWESSVDTASFTLSGYAITGALTRTCNTTMASMGIMAHELIHTMGPPDLYDGAQLGAGGLGGFDLMSNAFGPTGRNGASPGSLSPWTKQQLQWITPNELTSDGIYSMRPSTTHADYFIISDKYPTDEYLLLEYRRPMVPYELDFFGAGGLVIYHVDDTANLQTRAGHPGQANFPSNGNHYQVAVLQADGQYDLEKRSNLGDANDLYTPGMSIGPGTGSNFPNTDSYQNGNVQKTGITITVQSMDADRLFFEVSGLAPAVTLPTQAPTQGPTRGPTQAPTRGPTQGPTLSPTTSTTTSTTTGTTTSTSGTSTSTTTSGGSSTTTTTTSGANSTTSTTTTSTSAGATSSTSSTSTGTSTTGNIVGSGETTATSSAPIFSRSIPWFTVGGLTCILQVML